MKLVKYNDSGFKGIVDALENRGTNTSREIETQVNDIITAVRDNGDSALFQYTQKYDKIIISPENIAISKDEIKAAYKKADKGGINALKAAAANIEKFHAKQKQSSWQYKDRDGNILGQMTTPIDKAGIYVPGGKASYPSSVLMNTIPAKVAGVNKIYMYTPLPNNYINPYVVIAADIAGVDTIFKIGGAQAIAAGAYGTKSVPRVDKIVGPGNIYVATAKRLVFGRVDIDMIAGPSEILIIADDSANPEFIAADLLAQAEHDEMAVPIAITTSEKLAKEIISEIDRQKLSLKRRDIIDSSLKDNLCILIAKDIKQAVDISNRIAPEHLELAVKFPFKVLKGIKNAGAVFLGNYTPESLGDYAAGPNHVLPTEGTARFSSPLGVYDFQKRSSIISFTKKGCEKIAKTVEAIAMIEGLDGHANAVRVRMGK